jgi:hypothetical protein
MANRLHAIRPGSAEFNAWLAYHRGTKAEARMLSALAGKRTWYAPSKLPPVKADAARVTQHASGLRSIEAVLKPTDKPPARIEDIAERIEKTIALAEADAAELQRRTREHDQQSSAMGRAMTRVQEGRSPKLDGGDIEGLGEHFSTLNVFDPFEEQRVRDGALKPDKLRKRAKLISVRDDPVGRMHKRSQITISQLHAARWMQAQYAAAEIGGARGIDPSCIRVDGGAIGSDGVTDARLRAIRQITRADAALGYYGAELVRRVLGEGMEVKQYAASKGNTSQTECERLGWRLRECLDAIAEVAGLAAEGRGTRTPRDQHAEAAKLARTPALHRAIRAAKAKPSKRETLIGAAHSAVVGRRRSSGSG